jgi:RHS repeat-associated protein
MWEQTGTVSGTHDSAFAKSHFAYDNLSRLTASWRDEQAGKGEWFGYHATGQLTDVAYNADNVSNGTPQNATRTVNYAMTADTLNRSTMTDTGELSVYTPNALNQYTDLNGGGLYYDGNFNLMWTGGFSAGYDADKRLTAIGSGEDYGQFVYDGLGRCLKRTVDWETILITYDGWKPIVEWDQWNGLKAWNVYGTGPDEILYRHDAYLAVDLSYHLDRIGNVAFILDGNGNGIERYTYDAFGTPTVTDWDGNNLRPYSWFGNRFMFTGREYFPELGLYDYRNRFYHPILGRFLQSDPIGFGGDDANLYRYCGGDPVNRRDPSGLLDICGDGPCILIRPDNPFANGAQSLPAVPGANTPGSNVGNQPGPGPSGTGGPASGGPSSGGGGPALGGGDRGGPSRGTNGNGTLSTGDGHSAGNDGGGGGSGPRVTVVVLPGIYSHEALFKRDGTPAAGLTDLKLGPNYNGGVTLFVDTKVDLYILADHPELLDLEWEHVTMAEHWASIPNRTGAYASPLMRRFENAPRDLATGREVLNFIQPGYVELLLWENALDRAGGPHYRPDWKRNK